MKGRKSREGTLLDDDHVATVIEHRATPTGVTEVSDRVLQVQRRADRVDYGAEVTLYGLGRGVGGVIGNLSISGLFLETVGVLPRHTDVGFELPFLDGDPEPMRGKVVRIQEASDEREPGLGVAFFKVDARLRSRLVSLVKALRVAAEQAEEQEDYVIDEVIDGSLL